MTVRILLVLAVLLAGAGLPGAARAAITCTVVSDPDLNYGTVDLPISPSVTSSTFVRVRCSGSAAADRGVSRRVCVGLQTPVLPRLMANGAASVQHGLYQDAARTQHIQYGTPNAEIILTLPASGGLPVTVTGDVPIYGKLLGSSSNPPAGTYTEAVTGDMGAGPTSLQCANVSAGGPVNFTATTIVRANCTIVANDLSFGTVNLLTANVDSTTSLGLTCTNGAAYTVRLNGGTVTGNVTARRMGLGGAAPGVINYQLRHTSANGPLWGDGTAGTTVLTGTGTGASQTIAVYGRVPGGQPPPPVGTYSDTVTVSVEF